jgi:uroporphyrinogen-III synthase
VTRLLEGKLILVTRPRHQVKDLSEPLEALGAEVAVLPAIAIEPPEDSGPLEEALKRLSEFDWVIFTSANGVESVRQFMAKLDIPIETLTDRRLAVIGPSTGAALAESFRPADAMPTEFVQEAILDCLGNVSGLRFLLPRADLARKELPTLLTESGAVVEDVCAYRIQSSPESSAELPNRVPDAILLTSSAGVKGTMNNLRSRNLTHWMSGSALICIGPITAETARSLGYQPAAVAVDYNVAGLLAATERYFSNDPLAMECLAHV